ncbi:MAG: type II toxin-antitoxin system prevent-host-death family antitoxin [Opitutales bacterium]|nr:type II toxin-antitoxin system prevent-host-death family antitoxin [Opitutales bacterium]
MAGPQWPYAMGTENPWISIFSRVCLDRDPVIITRKREQSVVMISLEDYEALEETAYLLRSPANAKRLAESIEAAEQGKVIEKTIALDE